jgi:phosphoribosylaminoimidazolecarboxamide formyltransferase / IMP cyclohydrolase
MTDLVRIHRALISVSDKTLLIERAHRLAAHGVELISTGGTARTLREAGLAVREVSELTRFPEMMDGRVKTLHPGVHGGLLADRNIAEHVAAMEAHGIAPIDLLYVNLYPFEQTLAGGADYETCVENIDIGGPAMIRAAAKNHAHVAVCVDGDDLDAALAEMDDHGGATTRPLRRRLAGHAYARTAAYDAAISQWFAQVNEEPFPPHFAFGGARTQTLRYGENPHQRAAFYRDGRARHGVASARILQGKELSYNNLNDTDAAFELVSEFSTRPAVAIIKHANPCGVAEADTLLEAYQRALACDPVSAFGGVIAANRPLDEATAKAMTAIFTEVVIAPGVDETAEALFAAKKNLRLLVTKGMADARFGGLTVKHLASGFLVQDEDREERSGRADWKIVTQREPSAEESRDLAFAWAVAKHVKSNAIIYAKNSATVGIGAGQMSRVDSARIARRKAEDAAHGDVPATIGSACASDAFFPFADGLLQAAEAGATSVIQPGGSIRDDEVIAAADKAGLAMVFTGVRHFRH